MCGRFLTGSKNSSWDFLEVENCRCDGVVEGRSREYVLRRPILDVLADARPLQAALERLADRVGDKILDGFMSVRMCRVECFQCQVQSSTVWLAEGQIMRGLVARQYIS
jgi:hypothetical protein